MYFGATTPALGRELWALDSSVHLVKDIVPGSAFGMPSVVTAIAPLPGNRAIFAADDGLGLGALYWVTDGTPAGTRSLHDQSGAPVHAYYVSSQRPFGLLQNGRVLFNGYDPVHGAEPWITDGSDANTLLLADLTPGISDSVLIFQHNAGPIVYFSTHSTLWRSDGTVSGTFSLNVQLSSSVKFVTVGGFAYFVNQVDAGLWRTDGTIAGTTHLVNATVNPDELAALGSDLIFCISDTSTGTELWRFNTATSTPSLIADIRPGVNSGNPTSLTSVNGRVVFIANSIPNGREPWVTDGTPAGTHILADLNPGTGDSIIAPDTFRSDGTHAYFAAYVPPSTVVYVTDGTSAGTQPVMSFPPSSSIGPSLVGEFLPDNSGRLVFQGTDAATGQELWISDGTPTGTHLLADIAEGSSAIPIIRNYRLFSRAHAAIGLNGVLYFPALIPTPTSSQPALATATADPNSARIVRAFSGGLSEIASHSGRIYFPAYDGTSIGNELWSSDGSPAGTSLVADIAPQQSSSPRSLTSVGSRLFCAAAPTGTFTTPSNAPCTLFAATDGVPGASQVVSNTTSGLPRLRITEENSFNTAEALASALGKAFFIASTNPSSSSGPFAALVSDGTDQGTLQLSRVGSQTWFVEWNNRVYFAAYSTTVAPFTNYLQSTDGTPAGTTLVAPIPANAYPIYATADHLFLKLPDAQGIYQLWTLDRDSTVLRQLTTFSGNSGLVGVGSDRVALADRLIFSAGDTTSGYEPWVSDGTVAGTFRLADLVPGTGSSSPVGFTLARSTVYFIAANPDRVGKRLFQTDGTPAGTIPVPLAAGPQTISPFALTDQSLAQTNGRLYVIAANPDAQQVWYLDTCFADFDASGHLDVNDLFAFLSAWFGLDPHADTNADGVISVADLLGYINLWFDGCP
jgi:ELWxxDGT repeat protein